MRPVLVDPAPLEQLAKRIAEIEAQAAAEGIPAGDTAAAQDLHLNRWFLRCLEDALSLVAHAAELVELSAGREARGGGPPFDPACGGWLLWAADALVVNGREISGCGGTIAEAASARLGGVDVSGHLRGEAA